MKYFFLVLLFGIGFKAFGQINFRKSHPGYYIDSSGKKSEGLIRYIRGNNPRIEFKADKDEKKKKIYPATCVEFGFDSTSRFIKAEGFAIRIGVWYPDVTSDFIEVLEEGKISLFKHYSIVGDGSTGTLDVENLVVKVHGSSYVGLHPNVRKREKELKEVYIDNSDIIDILINKNVDAMRKLIKEYNLKNG
jgi:hypothetical protein